MGRAKRPRSAGCAREGPQAAGADVRLHSLATESDRGDMEIGEKTALGPDLGVADVVAADRAFAADCALL